MFRHSAGLLLVGCRSSAVTALLVSRRSFYDKVRKEREGSDLGPDAMFADFPKNPNPEQVPKALHTGNKEAVESAEVLNRLFLVSLVTLMVALGFFLDPFNQDQYQRPDKFIPVVEPVEKVPPRWAAKQ